MSVEDWHGIYSLSFCITKDTKLQNFQFKLLHRILQVNSFLYKCGLKKQNYVLFVWKLRKICYIYFGIVI